MSTVRYGTTAHGKLMFGLHKPIALTPVAVGPKPPKPEPPKPEPPKPEPPIVIPPKPEPPKPTPPRPTMPFPTDAEFTEFTTQLETLYREVLQRPSHMTSVDALGRGRWTYDYAQHRQQGASHAEAWRRVDAEVRRIAGVPPHP